MARVVTGVKPTGDLHLGHLVGLLEPAVALAQSSDEVFYFIADYHALTSQHDPQQLEHHVRSIAVGFLAAGVDPDRIVLFRQSAVPEHAELAWILGTLTPMGLLERAHAYKDALANRREVNAGIFSYPVLMAADILIYRGEVVPVGRDQLQHLEIARDIANKFNLAYGATFPLPQARVEEGNRAAVIGIDGRKMSKSYKNTIPILADRDTIEAAVRRIVTHSIPQGQPLPTEGDIVLHLMQVVDSERAAELERAYQSGSVGYAQAKQQLVEAIEDRLHPFRQRAQELLASPTTVDAILQEGGRRARCVAAETMAEVRKKVGLATPAPTTLP